MVDGGELPNVSLADVIRASGAGGAPFDEDGFYEAIERHKERMPSEAQLLGDPSYRASGIVFSITPSRRAERPLTVRAVEGDESAETTIGERQIFRDDAPFIARRYRTYHGKGKPAHEGGLEFAGDFDIVNDHRGVVEGLVKKRVVSVAIRNLGEVDITERQGGLVVAQWAGGRLLVPGAAGYPGEKPAASGVDEAEEPGEPIETGRERIVLDTRLEDQPASATEIRFGSASDHLDRETTSGIYNRVMDARQHLEARLRLQEREMILNDGPPTVLRRTTDARTSSGPEDKGIVDIDGIPATVEYHAESFATFGTREVAGVRSGGIAGLNLVQREGRKLTIVFNPESDEPEELEFDFDKHDYVERIIQLARELSIDGETLELKEAADKVTRLITGAIYALAERN